MNNDIYVIKNEYSLRDLPVWLAQRTYNTIRHGLRDKKGTALIGLSETNGATYEKQGLLCIYDRSLTDRVLQICQAISQWDVTIIDVTSGEPNLRDKFIDLVADNQQLMPEDAAISVTCAQIGVSLADGYALLNGDAEAQMTVANDICTIEEKRRAMGYPRLPSDTKKQH